MAEFLKLFAAWTLFVFAAVNVANAIISYSRRDPGSYGRQAILKMLLFGLALAGWEFLRR